MCIRVLVLVLVRVSSAPFSGLSRVHLGARVWWPLGRFRPICSGKQRVAAAAAPWRPHRSSSFLVNGQRALRRRDGGPPQPSPVTLQTSTRGAPVK